MIPGSALFLQDGLESEIHREYRAEVIGQAGVFPASKLPTVPSQSPYWIFVKPEGVINSRNFLTLERIQPRIF